MGHRRASPRWRWLLTLFAWLDSFDGDFSIWALLGMLTATAILVFAVLSLLPELRNRPALPGGLANAAQWANQPAPEFGQQQGRPGCLRPAGSRTASRRSSSTAARRRRRPAGRRPPRSARPWPGGRAAAAPAARLPGGSTASGEGPGSPDAVRQLNRRPGPPARTAPEWGRRSLLRAARRG